MCKYCKNLKRIKDLDEKEYKEMINSWRRRNLMAERLLCMLSIQLDISDHSEVASALINKVKKFLSVNYIGK